MLLWGTMIVGSFWTTFVARWEPFWGENEAWSGSKGSRQRFWRVGSLVVMEVSKWSFLAQEELLLSSIEELIIAMGNKG